MNSGSIWIQTPLGPLIAISEEGALTRVFFDGNPNRADMVYGRDDQNSLLASAAGQIGEYLDGRRREFTLPVRLGGTPFQKSVWEVLRTIPYGQTRSYREIARLLGKDDRYLRAVGSAIARNPLLLLVPCHRVIGSDGALTGYSGGMDRKKALLDLERRHIPR
ncbi:MAG: Methylated-DNA-[protein]-cysteine S-methyltransferase [Leptospirillum sp. Group II 'C75']|jgi:methylated-DNA-[protein]-cysteine S-methyltransferase|uniref:methylated-DNA--[protein]-cysteine S-methyltransferase n=1 Tax=Leptospirillum sp. Group II 'CF-1' TaxID=1660083 RepID=UPI0000F0C921|nr:methylated-DNA--[protein]-cysteine S-methyltransferase [Leptospirillum sp. Group II 'CF-1']AKS23199.1 hypothetical protein ABH19_04685 [Leptospirillum sp. Group II 'CF-1']EAY57097.1 MAG: Methylated-DNA-[protein]-cysteine S-methyltransferase [Leptospirillum rubarum]EIJ76558.1 MAG: Methylated-DNA-[protein]-cysteine S-methyltransferase [Leptospirillum sp. Group II 'C75']